MGEGKRSRKVKESERWGRQWGKSERWSEGDNKNSIYNSKWDAKKGIFLRNWKAIFLRLQIKINCGRFLFG